MLLILSISLSTLSPVLNLNSSLLGIVNTPLICPKSSVTILVVFTFIEGTVVDEDEPLIAVI